MIIYLLHLHPQYKHARHYLGITHNLEERLADHRHGTGARLTQVAIENDCALILARTWKGERTDERRLKNQKNGPRLCPLCNPKLKGAQ